MKKILSIILCLSMLLSCVALTAGAADNELIIDVVTDIHMDQDSGKPIKKRNDLSETFSHVAAAGMLYSESKAVIAAFLDEAAKDKSEVVLVPGDLADTGFYQEMVAVRDMFSAFENSTGKQIYVVPGNHDVSRTDANQFITVLADFGYNEAIARDENSASYVADLPDGYRLIAIDSTLTGSGKHGIDAKRAEWIRQQAAKAQEDGKKTIAMMHHNLLDHLVLSDVLQPGSVVGNSAGIQDIFAKYGVKYVFTGHTHESDIASYKGENGEVVYDVVTGALAVYPCPYRTVTFGDTVKFEINYVDKIEAELVPDGMSAEALELMKNNFSEYAKKSFYLGFEITLYTTICKPSYLKSILNLNETDHADMCALIDKLAPRIEEGLKMPTYTEDETEAGVSVESILAEYDVTIPDTKYETLADLVVEVYEKHIMGDENLQPFSKEVVLASKGIGALLMYVLNDVTSEEYAKALTFVCSLIEADVPANLIDYASDVISRFEGIELIVSTAVLPLILEITVDDAPADLNVTLPGYAELIEPEAELTFWEKVQSFFIKIFSFIMSLFAFI